MACYMLYTTQVKALKLNLILITVLHLLRNRAGKLQISLNLTLRDG